MRTLTLSLSCSILALGCTETGTTPAGPLAQVDLRPKLPEGVAVPEALDEHEAVLAVCDVDDDPFEPVGVRIIWHAFATADGDAHVVDYAVSVATPSEGYEHSLIDLVQVVADGRVLDGKVVE